MLPSLTLPPLPPCSPAIPVTRPCCLQNQSHLLRSMETLKGLLWGSQLRLLRRLGLRVGLVGRLLVTHTHTHKWYLIDQHSNIHVSFNHAIANLGTQPLGVAKCLTSTSNLVFVAHPLCPPHLRGLVEEMVQAVDNSWLLPHVEGEVFKSGMALLARLQSNALHKGFGIVTITSNAKRFDWVHSKLAREVGARQRCL